MSGFESILKSMDVHANMLKEIAPLNKDVLFAVLSKAEIDRVTVRFDGEGDSGQLDEALAYKGQESVPLPTGEITIYEAAFRVEQRLQRTCPVPDAVEALCYDFLEQEHGGWENNDGAFGEFVFDVTKRTVELEFNGRYTDINTSNHTF